jgi:hypothetical protein
VSVSAHRYRFRRTWFLDANPDDVYEVLYAVPLYPGWWPHIRRVRRTGPECFEVLMRSVLPYRLRIELTRDTIDPHARVLQARMRGDVVGTSRWQLESACDGTRVCFWEDAELARGWLVALEPAAIPLFVMNHRATMRAAERGLRAAITGIAVVER